MIDAADRLLARMARHGGRWAVLLALASIIGAIASTLLPALLGRTVDALIEGRGGAAWAAGCAALVVVIAAGGALQELATGTSAAASTAWLRRLLCAHVLAAGPALSRALRTGDVVSRLVAGAGDAGRAPAAAVTVATALVPTLGAPVALWLIDPWLAVAFLAGLPALGLILGAFMRDTSRAVGAYLRTQAAIAARLVDALAGARTVAAAGTVEQEEARVLAPLGQLRETGRATWRPIAQIAARGTLFVPLLQALILTVGGIELAAGRTTAGGLLAASQYAALGSGVGSMLRYLNRIARARASARRAVEVLAVPAPAPGARELPPGPGRLELCRVTVRLEGRAVLDGLDLTVPGGAVIAVVGRSGAGKSLLAALAGRLLDPDEGEVLLDGVPLRGLRHDVLRAAVQCAFERPALLGVTVADAIRFGAAMPEDDEVERAASDAGADPFIRRLPRGYETPLAEAPLSGGEAQRIGLARALAHARGARLLILDDATSSLDTVTEMQVSRALLGQLGLTRLVVAHRAATAARAQGVAWLEGGRVRACGPHAELWGQAAYRAVFEP